MTTSSSQSGNSSHDDSKPIKWGALFPGQGSQSVGMGKFLFENFKSTKMLFEEASDALAQDMKKLCFDGPDDALSLTENTQPALLLVSVATFKVVQETTPLKIHAGAGHSVGEYAAVVTSGALGFSDGLRAVKRRGQAMQKAVPVGAGAMAAVLGLSDEQVIKLCAWAEKETGLKSVEPANFNSPGQVVISGRAELIKFIRENAKSDIFAPETPRLKLIPLQVSAPFHCQMMKPAEEEMRDVLNSLKWSTAQWPIMQNFTATAETAGKTLCDNLISQIVGAVRWTQCMQNLKAMGITHYVEYGAGKVLAGLAKKIDSEGMPTLNINTLDDIKNLESLSFKQV